MKIAVAGGTGVAGRWTAEALRAGGHEVIVIARSAGIDLVTGNGLEAALAGADDGELFMEYGQTEALMFDNGRLKQATYDTSQGFGLRAVKDDAVGYAHSSDVSLPALIRAADAVAAVRGDAFTLSTAGEPSLTVRFE